MQYGSLREELTDAVAFGVAVGGCYGILANHSLGQYIADMAIGGVACAGLGGLILGLDRIVRGNRNEETIDAAVADQRSISPDSK